MLRFVGRNELLTNQKGGYSVRDSIKHYLNGFAKTSLDRAIDALLAKSYTRPQAIYIINRGNVTEAV